MGSTSYSSTDYSSTVRSMAASGATFKRSAIASSTGDFTKIADCLNPRKLKNGVRESCYAKGFDDVTSVIFSIDCTGSMEDVPKEIQAELPKLIDALIAQSITDHPNLMFMGHDDEIALPPDACFQMSQFEIGTKELVESLNQLIIPLRGGGNQGEGYHISFYAAANHTKLECFDKKGQKGFLILICDEQPYYDNQNPAKRGMTPQLAKELFNDTIEKEIPMLDSVKKAAQMYHIFVVRPGHTQNGSDKTITTAWQKLLQQAGENPEHVLEIQETSAIISTVALAIGRLSGVDADSMVDVLISSGAIGVDDAAKATNQIVARVDSIKSSVASGDLVTSTKGKRGRSRI